MSDYHSLAWIQGDPDGGRYDWIDETRDMIEDCERELLALDQGRAGDEDRTRINLRITTMQDALERLEGGDL